MRFAGWELVAAIASCLASLALVPAINVWARRRRLLDVPIDRSAHTHPKPRLGGLGVVAGVAVGVLGAVVVGFPQAKVLVGALGVAAAVGAVSLIDDLRGLPALPRLAVHVASAAAAVWWLGAASHVFLPGGVVVSVGVFGPIATLVWIVIFINAFNFMDGVDGIAGAQAVAAGLAWVVIGFVADLPAVGWMGAVIVGASLGFLQFNWQPSRIFLGDVGATFLGCCLAIVPSMSGQPDRLMLPGVLVAWPFVADVLFTLADRARRGEYLFAGHQQHVYQRLVARGWSHAQVALAYAALSGLGGVAAIGLVHGGALMLSLGVLAIAASAILFVFLSRRPHSGPAASRALSPDV